MGEVFQNLVEGQFGTGLLPQVEDKRDLAFSAVLPFDWELGFDIELLLGYRAICSSEAQFWGKRGRNGWGVERYREIVAEARQRGIQPLKLPVKNQGASSSCTGQGLSYYLEVLNMIETGQYVKVSAKDIYAYISLGEGLGAYLRDALKLACSRGIATEELVPCYEEIKMSYGIVRNPLTEKEYLQKPEETPAIKAIRSALQSKEYKLVEGFGVSLMDQMAWAMLMGFGTYFAVDGENNGTWLLEYPKPPASVQWKHALFAGKAMLVNGKKTICPINSWGNSAGIDGWQKLQDNYFIGANAYTPWTLIDRENNFNTMTKSNVKIIKDSNSPAVGIWLPATSPAALESYCLNFGIEVPKKEDGSIDWEKWVDGKMTLK